MRVISGKYPEQTVLEGVAGQRRTRGGEKRDGPAGFPMGGRGPGHPLHQLHLPRWLLPGKLKNSVFEQREKTEHKCHTVQCTNTGCYVPRARPCAGRVTGVPPRLSGHSGHTRVNAPTEHRTHVYTQHACTHTHFNPTHCAR